MKINNVNNINFGIYKGCKPREYGQYLWGEYKDYKIEVYDAYNYGQKLIYMLSQLLTKNIKNINKEII